MIGRLRVHRDVLAENRRLWDMVVRYAQEYEHQRAELRSAVDMLGHYRRLIDSLETRIIQLARDFDALMGVSDGGGT